MTDPQAIAVERETRQRKIMGAEQARVLDAAKADKARAVAKWLNEAHRRIEAHENACAETGEYNGGLRMGAVIVDSLRDEASGA